MDNMNVNLAKTTVEIDANLLYHAKRMALEEKKTLKEVFEEGVKKILIERKYYSVPAISTEMDNRKKIIVKYAGIWAGKEGEKIAKEVKKMRKTAKILDGRKKLTF